LLIASSVTPLSPSPPLSYSQVVIWVSATYTTQTGSRVMDSRRRQKDKNGSARVGIAKKSAEKCGLEMPSSTTHHDCRNVQHYQPLHVEPINRRIWSLGVRRISQQPIQTCESVLVDMSMSIRY
ncbi:hypothetical protein COCMIDRAFT_106104, partial [Bipolaris oryzae ATCC 44560]